MANYMEKQFVTYEIALKLKELGFDEECFGCWETNTEFYMPFMVGQDLDKTDNFNSKNNCISAPLWQQVIDWLREEYQIEIRIYKWFQPEDNTTWYNCKVIEWGTINENWDVLTELGNYATYSEAEKQAILKAIELIENNKNHKNEKTK